MTRKGNERRRRQFAEADDHAAVVDAGRAVPWGLRTLGVTPPLTTEQRKAALRTERRRIERQWLAASDEERRFRAAYNGEGRFKLAECDGYSNIGTDTLGLTVAVLDSAVNFRTVRQFRTESTNKRASQTREIARRFAAALEWRYAR